MVSDLHELLRSLPLPINSIQKLLLVPLQDAEPCLKGLEHAWVLILDTLRQDERVEAAWITTCINFIDDVFLRSCFILIILVTSKILLTTGSALPFIVELMKFLGLLASISVASGVRHYLSISCILKDHLSFVLLTSRAILKAFTDHWVLSCLH